MTAREAAAFHVAACEAAVEGIRSDDGLIKLVDLVAREFGLVGSALLFTDDTFAERGSAFVSNAFRGAYAFVAEIHAAGEDAADAELMRRFFASPGGRVHTESELERRHALPPQPSLMRDVLVRHCGVSERGGLNVGRVGGSAVCLSLHFGEASGRAIAKARRAVECLALVINGALAVRQEIRSADRLAERLLALKADCGLTFAEHEIVRAIARGDTGRTIASARGISYETYRSHVKNVFRKTGVNSRSRLVAMLLT